MADEMMRHIFPCDFDPPDCYFLTNKVFKAQVLTGRLRWGREAYSKCEGCLRRGQALGRQFR